MDGGDSAKTIVTNGPLKIKMKCLVDPEGFQRVEVQIFATSTSGNWFESDQGEKRLEGEKVTLFSADEDLNDKNYTDGDDGISIASKDGKHYIAINGQTLGLGLNVLGHDCVAIGTATSITQ